MKLSFRYKNAGIEQAQNGIGVTTTARMYARQYWASQGNEVWARERNNKVNDLLAMDFAAAELRHLFKLRDDSIAEVRKSQSFFFIAKRMGGSYVIIKIQPNYKEAHPNISKQRIEKWK